MLFRGGIKLFFEGSILHFGDVDEEFTVEVIQFVAEGAGEEVMTGIGHGFAVTVEALDGDVPGAVGDAPATGDREAAFLGFLFAAGGDIFGFIIS